MCPFVIHQLLYECSVHLELKPPKHQISTINIVHCPFSSAVLDDMVPTTGHCILLNLYFPKIQVSKKLMDDHDFFTSQRYGDNGTCKRQII
jgi:hypothetical protein